MVDFGQILTAMITPFDDDGNVNYDCAAKLANYLVDNGTDTLVVCGTTGESPTLTWEEEYKLFSVILERIGDRALVMAGCGSNSTLEAIAATQKAARIGVHGALHVVPYYNKPPQEGLYQHFAAIAQAESELPILLYNVPGRTGQNLGVETVARLAQISNIIGIKEASGNIDQVSEISRLTPSEFQIYSGDDSLTLPMLSVGAKGVVSVASHLVGKDLQSMIQSYNSGDVAKATSIHLRLFPLFKALFATTNPIPIKIGLNLQGWQVGSLRPPLVMDSRPQLTQKIKDIMGELGLLESKNT